MKSIRVYAKTIKANNDDCLLAALETLEGYFGLPYSFEENGEFWFRDNSDIHGCTLTECEADEADFRLFSPCVDLFFKRV